MGETSDAIRKYLTALKESRGFSWSDLSAATGLPDSTIRKIFSGETSDPRLETISLIVSALGGSLDAMLAGEIEIKEPESNDDSDRKTIKEFYNLRVEEMKRSYGLYIDSLKRDKTILFIIVCILASFLMVFLIVDLSLGSAGWIRY